MQGRRQTPLVGADRNVYAVAQGTVAVQQLTLEETRKYLEYQKREYGAAVDPAAVTEPMLMVRIDGTGAFIRE